MATLRVNILSNYAGQLWMAFMAVAFLPLYIRILGMEAFGLVGLLLSFQSILQIFDFGIGGSTNRELSRRAHDDRLAASARDLVRTSELIIWLVPTAIALLAWASSGLLANEWLNLRSMRPGEGARAIALMGVAIALLWPSTFYANCLSGLERQPTLNVINAAFATLRFAGVLPVLWQSPTIEAFLAWHAVVGLAQSLATAAAVWRSLPRATFRPRINIEELRRHSGFAGGLFVVSLLALGVTQLDRLVLTTLRPLEEMGQYTLALSVAAGLGRMVQPMFNALYPRFSRLVARNEIKQLSQLYHLSSQYLAVVVSAIAMVLIVFARDVLFLWAGDEALATRVAVPLGILVAGTALNGLLNIPYALQLANGWTRLALAMNAISLVIGVPYCLWAITNHGIVGAAGMCLLTNLISFAVGVPLMHRKLLRGEMSRWFGQDVLPPLLASTVVTVSLAASVDPLPRTPYGVIVLAVVCAATLTASVMASRSVRRAIAGWAGLSGQREN
ncbi:oligosaccharide flippase family protein [Luteimonas mephitis]|uniref:oligosaccharide flippase family protein n=1 Tax=Luteimonas mephitis TaxID=83615 RepID=UPI003A8CB942